MGGYGGLLERGLISFFHSKKGGAYERGGLFEGGGANREITVFKQIGTTPTPILKLVSMLGLCSTW